MNYKIVEQVSRKKKSMSGVLRVVMIIFAVLFVVMGITISQAFMLPGFLLAGLYFVFDIFSQKDYEYMMENGQFEIDVIYGKKYRKTAHILLLQFFGKTVPEAHMPCRHTEMLPQADTSYLGKVLPQFHLPKNTDRKEQKSVRRFPY